MSTHPRDFPIVANLAKQQVFAEEDGASEKTIIPCMGVHPWFLHELTKEDWQTQPRLSSDDAPNSESLSPRWVSELESLLQADPSIVVGEIGLDNFHFNDPVTKELSTDMETQMLAMEYQLNLAIQYQRPVSVHCVRAMGSMLEVFNKVLKNPLSKHKLPPRIYFHAFGGKAATVIQLIRLLEPKPKKQKKKKKTSNGDGEENDEESSTVMQPQSTTATDVTTPKVYFGFAPVINFQSPKTLEVIREVGLQRLVLETDHEEAYLVPSAMKEGVRVISEAFRITEDELIEITNKNAQDLYLKTDGFKTS